MHLNDDVLLERLEAIMPNAFDITWTAAFAHPNVILYQTCTYARQLESIVARWRNGDHSMLQPVVADAAMAVAMIGTEMKREAGRKQLELIGQSSGALYVAGSANVFQGSATKEVT